MLKIHKYTGLGPIYVMFFKFLLISFQIKIMMICSFDSNKVSKSLNFFGRQNQFIPFGLHVHYHKIWVKISTFNKDESTHLPDF